jgi:hypothetical protein
MTFMLGWDAPRRPECMHWRPLTTRPAPFSSAQLKYEVEGYDSVLCRYLRARKFDVAATVTMINESFARRQQVGQGLGGPRPRPLVPVRFSPAPSPTSTHHDKRRPGRNHHQRAPCTRRTSHGRPWRRGRQGAWTAPRSPSSGYTLITSGASTSSAGPCSTTKWCVRTCIPTVQALLRRPASTAYACHAPRTRRVRPLRPQLSSLFCVRALLTAAGQAERGGAPDAD